MRVRLSILAVSLPLAGLAGLAGLPGCKSETETISGHPYFLKMLDNRWEIIRKSFKSDKPEIGYTPIVLKDISGLVDAMRRTYTKPNRDQAIAKLEAFRKKFRAELEAKVDTRYGTVRLMPGATVAEVGEVMERGYQEYLEFKKML